MMHVESYLAYDLFDTSCQITFGRKFDSGTKSIRLS